MRTSAIFASALVVAAFCGCIVSNPALAQPLACDDSIKTKFAPDAQTTVVLVKAFKKGEKLLLSRTNAAQAPIAANDVCLVKLMVGPGNPGPTGAPSTSAGIGIEVWLPSQRTGISASMREAVRDGMAASPGYPLISQIPTHWPLLSTKALCPRLRYRPRY